MLTAKQFEAIGRVALLFNQIEWACERWYAAILGVPEMDVAIALSEEGMFTAKVDRLTKLFSALDKQWPDIKAAVAGAKPLLTEAKALAGERNRYVHALMIFDPKTAQTRLRRKKENVPGDLPAIERVGAKAYALDHNLNSALYSVFLAVEKARKSKGYHRVQGAEGLGCRFDKF